METRPDLDSFVHAYERGEAQVVSASLVADLETPVSALLKLAEGRPYSFLLESVTGGAVRGRYSIIGIKPDLIWRCRGNEAEINRQARFDPHSFEACAEPALDSLRRLIKESRIELPDHLPPMAAGLFGHMAYDMVRLVERLPEKNTDRLGLPDAVFLRPTVMAIFDSIEDRVTVVSNVSRERYHEMVEQAKEYIRAGDIFQVVPSQRFELPFSLPPFALYRALRRLNPSPFLFFLDLDGYALVGSSPEILVRLRDGKVTVRPIAGTRRRGANKAEDEALAKDMLSDPKELAEHLMLLDLGRNDVGRVAQIGTVRVTEKMIVEYYSHVMHIVSNVEGMIRPDRDALDALLAGFPAGTVSGAPKVRAMEIIEELEPERRGFYAGAVGYFGADGTMDSCIALRTALIKDGRMYLQAGGGVVADSDPEGEYQESCNKARALIRAAEEAVRFASGSR
jgi:anthranilate synthase component 1